MDENKSNKKMLSQIKKMKNITNENNFKIIGEFVQNRPLKVSEGFEVILSDGSVIYAKKAKAYNRLTYKVTSYIHVGKNEYVAVLKHSWKIEISVVLILAVLLIGGNVIKKDTQEPDIDPSIKDYVSDLKRPDNLDKTQILMPSFTRLVMDADTDVISNTTLFNPENNPCYFQFTIVHDNGEILYKSKLIPPGKGITGAKLNRKMAEGTYKVRIRINTFDLNNYRAEFNGAEIASELRALK